MTNDELLARIELIEKGIMTRRRLGIALREAVKKAKPRAHKNEIDDMYIQGWNAAMNKVIKAIERELK